MKTIEYEPSQGQFLQFRQVAQLTDAVDLIFVCNQFAKRRQTNSAVEILETAATDVERFDSQICAEISQRAQFAAAQIQGH